METTTYNTPDELRVEVRVPAGHVTVLAKDTDVTTLEIAGVKNPDDLVISFGESSQGHRLVIEQRKKGIFNVSFTRGVEVRLTVPQQTKLEVKGGSTDLAVDGTIAAVDFNSASGDASLDEVTGDAFAKVASGDLSVNTVGGALTFHSASGDVRADKVAGKLVARTASGDVEVGLVNNQANITTVSGDVRLANLIEGSVNLQAVSGDIEVGIAPGSNVYLDLSSLSGSTKSDLPISDSPTPAPADKTNTASVKAATISGDIMVRHSSRV